MISKVGNSNSCSIRQPHFRVILTADSLGVLKVTVVESSCHEFVFTRVFLVINDYFPQEPCSPFGHFPFLRKR